ncbi:MAG: Uma2 family endonuclease [Sphingomonadaceae bacterium]|nr:Uma2 family endonuclease [Sphingomonadaceae bacterium]
MNEQVRIIAEQPDLKARFTAAEFLRMADAGAFDDMKVELIGGELYRMTPPMTKHARLQAAVGFALMTLLREHSDIVTLGEIGIILNDDTVVGADAAVARISSDDNRRLVPEDVLLVVEVAVTTVTKDSGIKRLAYAAAEIPEYWIVDGKRDVIHIHTEPNDGDYAIVRTVRFGEPFAVLDLPDTITID